MKKIYRQFLLCFWGLFFLGTVVAFGVVEIIDPYGERVSNLLGLKYNYSSSVLNARRHLRALSERPSILVFGSSRSLFLSPAILGSDVLNLQVLYGSPSPVLDFLQRMDKRQRSNILEIYYLLDLFSFKKETNRAIVDYESTWQRLKYKIENFGGVSLSGAWHKLVKNILDEKKFVIHPDGYVLHHRKQSFDGKLPGYYNQEFDLETVALLGKVDEFARRYKIKITYFRAPTPLVTLKQINFSKKKLFTESLLRQIDGYYDWNCLDWASPFNNQFLDYYHAKIALVTHLFRKSLTPEYYVTNENVDAFLERTRECYAFDKSP